MQSIQLSNLERQKPVSLGLKGELLNVADIERGEQALLIDELDLAQKKELAMARIQMDPEHEVVVGLVKYSKSDIINAIKSETDIGIELIHAEMWVIQDLLDNLKGKPKFFQAGLPDPNVTISKKHIQATAIPEALFSLSEDAQLKSNAEYKVKNVMPAFEDTGFYAKLLTKENLNRQTFQSICVHPEVIYVSGLGHGDPDRYYGEDPEAQPLWQVGKYEKLEVTNKIIHLRACFTADELGPHLVSDGAKAFLGYNNHVYFYSRPVIYPQPPLLHDLPSLCDSMIDLSLAFGCTCETAVHCANITYDLCIDYARAREDYAAELKYLYANLKCFRSPNSGSEWGNKKASLITDSDDKEVTAKLKPKDKDNEVERIDLRAFVSGLLE